MLLGVKSKYAQMLNEREKTAIKTLIEGGLVFENGDVNISDLEEYAQYSVSGLNIQASRAKVEIEGLSQLLHLNCYMNLFCIMVIYYIEKDFKLPVLFLDIATNEKAFCVFIKTFVKNLKEFNEEKTFRMYN